MLKKIIIIGVLPPLVSGQATATDILYKSLKKKSIDVKVIELSHLMGKQKGVKKIVKIWHYLKVYLLLFSNSLRDTSQIIYLSPGRTVGGVLRDLPIIIISKVFFSHKLIFHHHSGDFALFYRNTDTLTKKIINFCYNKVDRIVILSENLLENVVQSKDLYDKVVLIPYGLPSPNLSFEHKKLPNSEHSEFIELIYLSNFVESKGYLDVIEAFGILHNHYKVNNAVLNLYGNFILEDDDKRVKSDQQAKVLCNRIIKSNNIEHLVHINSPIHGKQKEEVLRKSHFLLLPTNYIAEAMPLTIIEGLSYGCVVITTSHRAIPDMVVDDLTGKIVPFQSPEGIAKTLFGLFNDPEKYTTISENSIKFQRNNLSSEVFGTKFHQLFRELSDL
jgi:glycosyltransferase involved in cell wall biosynthesis